MNNNSNEFFDPQDVEQNKLMGILSYLGLLWLIPFFYTRGTTSEYMRFHQNQGLWTVFFVIATWISKSIPFIGGFLSFVLGTLSLIVCILGIISASNGKKEKLPILGDVVFFK